MTNGKSLFCFVLKEHLLTAADRNGCPTKPIDIAQGEFVESATAARRLLRMIGQAIRRGPVQFS